MLKHHFVTLTITIKLNLKPLRGGLTEMAESGASLRSRVKGEWAGG